MKKLYTLLIIALIGFVGNAQIVNIPDNNFKAKLLSATATNNVASSQPLVYNSVTNTYSVSSYNKIDTNNDGQIQVSEAQAITYLRLSSSASPNLSNLTGIESFNNLQYLDCSDVFYASFTSLNLSQNTALKYFNCFLNNLSSLNISQCLALTHLTCGDNQLTSLDLLQHIELKLLSCGSNQLTTLNLSQNTGLISLWCDNNQLTGVDVSQNLALKSLNCSANLLASLDVSQNSLLMSLDCFSNLLTNLNVSQNPLLERLEFSYNQITNVDLSQNPNLKFIFCRYGQLASLDVSQNHALQELTCNNAQLTSLNVSQNPALKKLFCNLNHLTTLDLQNTVLVDLDCSANQLTSLLIKNGNPLIWSSLNFSENPSLRYVCADEEDTTTVQQRITSYGISSTCHLNSYCSFTPGATFYTIQGNTRFDNSANGCDVDDISIPNQKFNATNGAISGSFISNVSGSYFLPVLAGNHTITPVFENPGYFATSPTSTSISFPSATSPNIQDFCVIANGIKNDLEITFIALDMVRPGFDADYKIIYKNKGNQIANGTLSLNFNDDIMDLLYATPINNGSGINVLSWNFSNLNPFETREIRLRFNLNSPVETPPVQGGDILNYTVTIVGATDETPTDNTSTLRQTVVNSFDPNDKICIEGTTVSPAMVGQYVHYVVRFENTGTANAINVVVKDLIDITKFDISSLIPQSGSHPFVTRIITTNRVEFIFENINLPFDDANNDGYVAFKIKTKPTLVVGNTFSNTASIYFDYNFPIVTNTYTTTIATLGNQDFDFGSVFTLSPVPAKNSLTITTNQNVVMSSVSIYNALGQLVQVNTNPNETIDVSGLRTGTYFIKIISDKGTTGSKFVKE